MRFRASSLPFLLTLAACGLGDRQGGVVSETTNGLAGTVLEPGGGPAAAARVSWRPAAFLPGDVSRHPDTGSVAADALGRYAVGALRPAEYLLEFRSPSGRVAALRHVVTSRTRVDTLAPRSLAEPGELALTFASAVTGRVRVRAYGTTLLVEGDARDTLRAPGLAALDHRLHVIQLDRDIRAVFDSVPVAPGALTRADGVDPRVGTLQVTQPSRFARDSVRVHAFLERSGALKTASFDSVARRRGDSIPALILSGVALDSLPAAELAALGFLDTLWLNACRLKSLPPALTALPLTSLNLSYNSGLPVPAALFGMATLAHLDLSGLDLSALDLGMARLPALVNLSLRDGGLDSVPAALLANPRLRQLWLSGNRLASLPDAFTAGHALEKLLLDRNQLTALPASLRLLPRLQLIHLRENRLCTVPEETRTFIQSVPTRDAWETSQTGC